MADRPAAAEFFAGIGLVRMALDTAGFDVRFANDIEPSKAALYAANFPSADFVLGDIRNVSGHDVPTVALATASFPCTDLSLAGNRAGLSGSESSMFWEFARVIEEMDQRPPAVLLENVPSFATSHGGEDLRAAIAKLNELGYLCDLLMVDARAFVPQSRLRLFVVGSRDGLAHPVAITESALRPQALVDFALRHPELGLQHAELNPPIALATSLADVVERLAKDHAAWWEPDRVAWFEQSLSSVQAERLDGLRRSRTVVWATAYRRTRQGTAVWEIRGDSISGCLRTARGGSSKQALVEAGRGQLRVRWMTAREYARLQGAPEYRLDGVRQSQAIFGFGDAVCVPAVGWIAKHYLAPLVAGTLLQRSEGLAAA